MAHPLDVEALRAQVAALMPRALDDLAALVAMPSVADERIVPRAECDRAAEWVAAAFRAEGIADARPELTPDGSSTVVGYRPGPPGAPTVLLYSHFDVQPPMRDDAWTSPPFTLTERDGRLFGRGAADSKGNSVAHLTALRALRALAGDDLPVGVRLAIEGSEEQGAGGLDELVVARPELFAADVVLIADAGNIALGVPTLTVALRGAADLVVHVETMTGVLHSGQFGGAAPDALAALIALLAGLRDERGELTVPGIDTAGTWPGAGYDEAQFVADAGVLPGVELIGTGSVADRLWARPTLTVLGIDAPPVVGSTAAIQPRASARLNLRIPPGMDGDAARDALADHLRAAAPWGAHVTVETSPVGAAFAARTDTPAFALLSDALADAYGRPTVSAGMGGSIPLCSVLARALPEASIVLLGVEEPASAIHAPNESVHPDEIERLALGMALFASRLAQ